MNAKHILKCIENYKNENKGNFDVWTQLICRTIFIEIIRVLPCVIRLLWWTVLKFLYISYCIFPLIQAHDTEKHIIKAWYEQEIIIINPVSIQLCLQQQRFPKKRVRKVLHAMLVSRLHPRWTVEVTNATAMSFSER